MKQVNAKGWMALIYSCHLKHKRLKRRYGTKLKKCNGSAEPFYQPYIGEFV